MKLSYPTSVDAGELPNHINNSSVDVIFVDILVFGLTKTLSVCLNINFAFCKVGNILVTSIVSY